jgi:hypothetical protein
VENRLLTYLRWALAVLTATVIAWISLIFAFALWITLVLTNLARMLYLHWWRAKGQGEGPNVIEAEYEILDEPRDRSRSRGSTRHRHDKGTSR